MDYLNPEDYKPFGDFFADAVKAKDYCNFLTEWQEISLFTAFFKLYKAGIPYADYNANNWMIPLKPDLPAQIIDYGVIKPG